MICDICQFKNPPKALTCEKCQTNLFQAKIRIAYINGRNQTHYLFSQKYTLGRSADNDIVLTDPSVSRDHAEIEYKNGSFHITDKDSKNGSLLNDQHFKNRKLHHLDIVQLGNAVIHFYVNENKLPHPRNEFNTEERIQKEFFRFAEDSVNKITTDDVLLTMLDLSTSLVHADQAMILQFNRSNTLQFKLGKNQHGQTIFENKLTDFDWIIINDTIRKKEAKIIYKDFKSNHPNGQKLEHEIWHKMAIPLISKKTNDQQKNGPGVNGVLGVFYFIQDAKSKILSQRKKELLSTLVQHITYAVENNMLYEQTLENRKFEEELLLARQIQQRLFPTSHPKLDKFEIASYIHPCETVSGDYFDFIPISANMIGIAIGDICGKGMPAALLTSTVQAAIHSQLEYTLCPEEIVHNLNRLLIRSTAESLFITLFFGILDIESCELNYINAGHPPPIFISKNQSIKELKSTSPPLGILEEKSQAKKCIKFAAGDIVLMYTDGLIECKNNKKMLYSRKMLLKFIHAFLSNEKAKKFKLETLINSIKNNMREFVGGTEQNDDLTLIAVKRR
ncbi:MAG: SpoIIE family protein phosphatase [bacterium]